MQIYVIGIQSPKKRKIQMFSGFVLVYAVDERWRLKYSTKLQSHSSRFRQKMLTFFMQKQFF